MSTNNDLTESEIDEKMRVLEERIEKEGSILTTEKNIKCVRCGFQPKDSLEELSLGKIIFVFPVPKINPMFNNVCASCATAILMELAPPEIRGQGKQQTKERRDNRTYIG